MDGAQHTPRSFSRGGRTLYHAIRTLPETGVSTPGLPVQCRPLAPHASRGQAPQPHLHTLYSTRHTISAPQKRFWSHQAPTKQPRPQAERRDTRDLGGRAPRCVQGNQSRSRECPRMRTAALPSRNLKKNATRKKVLPEVESACVVPPTPSSPPPTARPSTQPSPLETLAGNSGHFGGGLASQSLLGSGRQTGRD